MDDEAIQHALREIESIPPGKVPRSHIVRGKPDRYIFITANRSGLLSFARAFLRAAQEPINPELGARPVRFDEPHEPVLRENGDLALGWIEHAEIVPVPDDVLAKRKRAAWRTDRIALLGCAVVGFMFLFLIFSGVVFWIEVFEGTVK